MERPPKRFKLFQHMDLTSLISVCFDAVYGGPSDERLRIVLLKYLLPPLCNITLIYNGINWLKFEETLLKNIWKEKNCYDSQYAHGIIESLEQKLETSHWLSQRTEGYGTIWLLPNILMRMFQDKRNREPYRSECLRLRCCITERCECGDKLTISSFPNKFSVC